MTETDSIEAQVQELVGSVRRLQEAVAETIEGYTEEIETVLLAFVAGGHVLLEGAPGLGKTTLVRALASALDLDFRRVQFTPDLMPADILGTRILQEEPDGSRRFTFERGPVFTHVLLADEVNRATPRTQSALLEAMQEHQITVFGETLPLEEPFCVVATENPIEMEGTYPLPEAQLDRFLVKVELGSPAEEELVEILRRTTGAARTAPTHVLHRDDVLRMRAWVDEVPASDDAVRLAARAVLATDPRSALAPEPVRAAVRWGASPRGAQALLRLAKAHALVRGRVHVAVEDLERVSAPALRHRLILGYEGEASGVHPDELVRAAFEAARAQGGRR